MIRWLWLLLLLIATPAAADELRPGYLEFRQTTPQEWVLVWKAPFKGGVTAQTRPIIPEGCKVVGAPQREVSAVALVTSSKVKCSGPVAGERIGLTAMDGSMTDILVRVAPLRGAVQAIRLTAQSPVGEIAAKPDRWQVFQTYFNTGVAHILFGYDHLLFVVALVLLLGRLLTIAKAVTAFTLAHSITLVGTTLGMIGLPQNPVESVIALSIMFLAVEILKQVPGVPRLSERVPWVVAFLFGLLHGFGFAGALKEIGLPEGEVPTALLAFNLGVEGGQLLIVAATLAMMFALRSVSEKLVRPATRIATYGIGVIAAYWFIERTLA